MHGDGVFASATAVIGIQAQEENWAACRVCRTTRPERVIQPRGSRRSISGNDSSADSYSTRTKLHGCVVCIGIWDNLQQGYRRGLIQGPIGEVRLAPKCAPAGFGQRPCRCHHHGVSRHGHAANRQRQGTVSAPGANQRRAQRAHRASDVIDKSLA